MSFDSPRYRTVKTILANGLDQAAQADAFDAISVPMFAAAGSAATTTPAGSTDMNA